MKATTEWGRRGRGRVCTRRASSRLFEEGECRRGDVFCVRSVVFAHFPFPRADTLTWGHTPVFATACREKKRRASVSSPFSGATCVAFPGRLESFCRVRFLDSVEWSFRRLLDPVLSFDRFEIAGCFYCADVERVSSEKRLDLSILQALCIA